jgi:hypothetical protein
VHCHTFNYYIVVIIIIVNYVFKLLLLEHYMGIDLQIFFHLNDRFTNLEPTEGRLISLGLVAIMSSVGN